MKFTKIFDGFPPPKFLDIPFAGVSISDTSVRSIQFGKKHSSLYIEKYSDKPIPTGFVLSGQINNKEELSKILEVIKKEQRLDYVRVSLPEEKAYLFTAKIPMLKQEEILSAIESKIEENVPVSPAELIFDYLLIPHTEKDHIDVVVSAIPMGVIDTYIEVVEKSGLSLLSLEIESQAVSRALLALDDRGTVLIIHFRPGKFGLYVTTDRIVRFTSTILVKEEFKGKPEFVLQEIKKLYIYWHTLKENVNKPEKKIERIIVCGEDSGDDIVPFLSAHNPTPVTLGNVWLNTFSVDLELPKISFSDSLKYASAVGLALPDQTLI